MTKEVKSIIATDCGSTTTKAILIEKVDDEYRLIFRGEAPTTVEAPFEDVTMGVRNAINEMEEMTKRTFLNEHGVITPSQPDGSGVDIYLSTSSAGGGLQMMVAGVVRRMTAESAERAALGAGAIVMDAIASNDGRQNHDKIQRIRDLRPDMILLSGGIDGGTTSHVAELAELIDAANPRPRLGIGFKIPIIFAGNKEARPLVDKILSEKTDLRMVDNLRPVLERENLGPARDEIHNLFMEHVMAQAPGYNKLMKWTEIPIMPTPGAVGKIIENTAKAYDITIIGVDIGGATTDVFSVFRDTFNRTVSANLGMSYSISNVLIETGVENVMRWIPFDIDIPDFRNRIRNKMIRPTTIPQTLEELVIEQAMAREALRLAFEHHKTLAVELKGVTRGGTMRDAFGDSASGGTIVDMMDLGMLVGSGGVLSHAPRRVQSVMMMLDAFQPEGVTRLTVDSIFMMPQLGILSEVLPEPAAHVFDRDCLIRLGTSIAPIYRGSRKELELGIRSLIIEGDLPSGPLKKDLHWGEIFAIPLEIGQQAKLTLKPTRQFDIGWGPGREATVTVEGGVVGLIFDGRGRPIYLPNELEQRRAKILEWTEAMDVYPTDILRKYMK